ncbi:MAG: hypothetical protein HW380_2852 [Magnetococcales bacterium]|nr:hypothetical protein [Magnetococcales bacterium]HIJ83198.1 class I SAM-dependent methyltransferase [Magnetococcales bacterium]
MDNSYLEDFDSPISLPMSQEQRSRWQEANRDWWENNPMQYDWKDGIKYEKFSVEYFQEIDKRFFYATKPIMPWKEKPFDNLIPFADLKDKQCLEIGVGCGTHAQLIAGHAMGFTGIDLTQHAVQCTGARMKLSGFDHARIFRMDAERMDFPDHSFDFVWSWGVIHHSADTQQVLSEIKRVLKPGGTAIIMVYHRNFWNYYIVTGLILGIIKGGFFRTRSLTQIQQYATDGALARHYTISEWLSLAKPWFIVEKIQIFGLKAQLLPIPGGKIKNAILKVVPDRVARFLVHNGKMGTFLVAKMKTVST